MPNIPKPPRSAYVYLAALGAGLIALGTTGLLVQHLSVMHGVAFLAGFLCAVGLLFTAGLPFLRRVSRRRLERMARAQGIDVRVVGAARGRSSGFDFDPETFAETRTPPKEEAWVEYLRLEYHAQAEPRSKPQSQAKKRSARSNSSLDKNIERLKRTVEHPATPEHERAAAAQQLAKLITKKSKKEGRT